MVRILLRLSPVARTRARAILILTLLYAVAANAQIVNIEDKRSGLDTIGWGGQLDLNGAYARNNNEVITLGAALRLDRRDRRGEWLLLTDYRLVKAGGQNALNAGFGHLRAGRDFAPGWRWESFTQLQYNERLRLKARWLLGTGVRRRLFVTRGSQAYLGVLYMYEYDEFTESRLFYRDHRLSNYFTLRTQLSPALYLAGTAYYQPRLPDFNDTRLSLVTNATLSVTSTLRFTTNLALTRDDRLNEDFPEVPATTLNWTNGLRFTF